MSVFLAQAIQILSDAAGVGCRNQCGNHLMFKIMSVNSNKVSSNMISVVRHLFKVEFYRVKFLNDELTEVVPTNNKGRCRL